MTGDVDHATVESVRRYWNERGHVHGYPKRRAAADDRPGMVQPQDRVLREADDTLVACVSMGRWVADCPNCGGGVALWRDNPEACCLTCGTVYHDVDWPTAKQMQEVELIMAARPEANRGWRRDRGETIQELRRENILHGYPTAALPL